MLYKRNESNFSEQLRNNFSEVGFSSENEKAAVLGTKLRKTAAIHFIEVNLEGNNFEERPNAVTAIDHNIKPRKDVNPEEYKNELGWTLIKPKDQDYKGILLSSEKPSISEVAKQFERTDFIIEDFEFNSPHAWRRMF